MFTSHGFAGVKAAYEYGVASDLFIVKENHRLWRWSAS